MDQPRIAFDPSTNGDYTITLNVNGSEVFGSIHLPDFDLPNRRLTLGNGWESGKSGRHPVPDADAGIPAVELSA